MHRVADDVLVGAARAGVLGVLLHEDQHDVRGEQPDEDRREQQDVDAVEAGDDRLARERAAEDDVGEVGAR